MPIRPSHSGFTLIELMVTVSILAILLSIGIPSFNETIRNNRTAAQANDLISALSLARSEAVKQGLPVAVCSANTEQTACADATNWANGWLVFRDEGTTLGAIDKGEPILQISRQVANGLQLSSSLSYVRFSPSGAPTNAASITFSLLPQGCTGTNRREIAINRTGRSTLKKAACT